MSLTIDISKPIADQLSEQGMRFSSESSVPFQPLADAIASLHKRGLLKNHEAEKASRRLVEKLEHHIEVDPFFAHPTLMVKTEDAQNPKPTSKPSPKAGSKKVPGVNMPVDDI